VKPADRRHNRVVVSFFISCLLLLRLLLLLLLLLLPLCFRSLAQRPVLCHTQTGGHATPLYLYRRLTHDPDMVSGRNSQRALLLSAAYGLANAVAVPEPTAAPAKVEARAPMITPAAIRFDGSHSYMQARDIIDDIKSGVDGVAKSWGSVLGTDLPSFFTDGKSKHYASKSLCS
jgi:hypothetical protein